MYSDLFPFRLKIPIENVPYQMGLPNKLIVELLYRKLRNLKYMSQPHFQAICDSSNYYFSLPKDCWS